MAATALWVAPTQLLLLGLGIAGLAALWVAATPIARAAPAAWRIGLIGLVGASIVSLYPSVDLGVSLPRFYGIVLGVAALGVLAHWLQSERMVWVVAWALLPAVMGIAAVGLVATDWPVKGKGLELSFVYERLPTLDALIPPMAGRLINPNKLAAPLAMLAPLAAAMVVFASGRWLRLAWAATGLLMFLVLVLTQSRTAYLAASGGLLAVLAFRSRWLALLFIPYIAFIAWVLIWIVAPKDLGGALPTPPMVGYVEPTAEGEIRAADLTLQQRGQVWEVAGAMVMDFPLTGVGLGMFPRVADIFYGSMAVFGPFANLPHAHDLLLQVAVDIGLPGLAFFVVLTAAAAVAGWRAIRGAPSEPTRAVVVGAVGGLLAYYLFGLTDVIGLGEKPGLLFWGLLGIVAAGARLASVPPVPAGRGAFDAVEKRDVNGRQTVATGPTQKDREAVLVREGDPRS
jgi:putative inorganic carbon (HCO3(-)) transporter